MNNKLLNDSTATFKPIIYQFYVALEKCFDLCENEKVYIEKYGDITLSANVQIEVKDYEEDLTDLDHNVWKTLKNWLDEKFDVTHYKSLILLTTQNFGKYTSFQNWNTKNELEKKQILDDISSDYSHRTKKSSETENLLSIVLASGSIDKLLTILKKFEIYDSSPKDDEYYEQLKQKHCKVLSINQDNFINSLLGYIVSPPITSNRWEITYESFSAKCVSLNEEYASTTKIFPKKYTTLKASEEEEKLYEEYKFVKKIEDIDYHEVKSEAISDFIFTRKILSEELEQHQINLDHYRSYEDEIHRTYTSKYRTASRKTDSITLIRDSKNFYDDITGEEAPNFTNFNDTPKRFRNGLLHEIADGDKSEKNIIWKLKEDK